MECAKRAPHGDAANPIFTMAAWICGTAYVLQLPRSPFAQNTYHVSRFPGLMASELIPHVQREHFDERMLLRFLRALARAA